MKRTRLLVLCTLGILIGTLWLLWVKPKPVDMSAFAPGNSLLYLEVNQPAEVLNALSKTDAWKTVDQAKRLQTHRRPWLQELIRITGIGPIDSVLIARSQLALVVTNLGATEEGETLNLKPEAAIIIETHTAERRIQTPIERWVQSLLKSSNANLEPHRSNFDGIRFSEWRDQNGNRRIVAAFYGSLVIIGNTQDAVDTCLNVIRRRQPSLKENPDLHRARASQRYDDALSFGYVPASESARLVSITVPLLLGRAPGDTEFQRLIGQAAKKLLGSFAWTSRPSKGGIEDRYKITLQQSVVTGLKPYFARVDSPSKLPESADFYSTTQYSFEDPSSTWDALRTTVSAHLDALGAVIFNSLLKSGLLVYGIEEPEEFLRTVKSDIRTLRLDQQGDRHLLIAEVRDKRKLTDLFEKKMKLRRRQSASEDVSVFENSDGNIGVALNESLVLMGHPSDVQQYFTVISSLRSTHPDQLRRITHFVDANHRSPVVTYTDDTERVHAFFLAVTILSGGNSSELSSLAPAIATMPYAVTETTLTQDGIERVTRSPLGLLSTLIPLLVTEPSTSTNTR